MIDLNGSVFNYSFKVLNLNFVYGKKQKRKTLREFYLHHELIRLELDYMGDLDIKKCD